MTWSSTCIIYPNSCEITAGYEEDIVYTVRGATYSRGDTYVYQELTGSQRNIATSILMESGELPLASMRLNHPVPKKETFRVMEVINTIRFQTPTVIGQVILHNVCGQDADVTATENVTHANA